MSKITFVKVIGSKIKHYLLYIFQHMIGPVDVSNAWDSLSLFTQIIIISREEYHPGMDSLEAQGALEPTLAEAVLILQSPYRMAWHLVETFLPP